MDRRIKMMCLSMKMPIFVDKMKKYRFCPEIADLVVQAWCKWEKEKCKCLNFKHLHFVGYPEPGSNRHGLLHWCLRPARLPIPPSGRLRCSRSRSAAFQ